MSYKNLMPKGVKKGYKKMATVYDVYPNDLIDKASEEMKNIPELKAPEWTVFVKTGSHKERRPEDPDWWYSRLAALLRSIYTLGPIGVNKLRTKYGGKKRRGHRLNIFRKASGSVIRRGLQQLEKAGFVENVQKGKYKGRKVTAKGKSFLDKIAVELVKNAKTSEKEDSKEVKTESKKEEPKKEKVEDKKTDTKKEVNNKEESKK